MCSVSSAVLAAMLLVQPPANHDNEAKAALAIAKAKAVAKHRIAANVAAARPPVCDGTCCDDMELARKRAWERKVPIVLFVGTMPKPDDLKALGDKVVVVRLRDYDADLDPKDAAVYKAAPRVWLLLPKAAGFELTTRWPPGEFAPDKVFAALAPR